MKSTSTLIIFGLIGSVIAKNVVGIDRFQVNGKIGLEKRESEADVKYIANAGGIRTGTNKGENQQVLENPTEDKKDFTMVYLPENVDLPRTGGAKLLSTKLTQINAISIFAGYLRDNVDVTSRVANKGKSTIIISPTNDAIESLSLKPWEFPNKIDDSQSDLQSEKLIKSNLDNFIKSHIIFEDSSFFENSKKFNKEVKTKNENGQTLYLKFDEDEFFVSMDSAYWIKIDDIKISDNGAILIINKTLIQP